jgi:deoxyribonuclease-4
MSVAGGVPKAVERAAAHGCDAFQIFTKNANQWRGRPLGTEEILEFRARVAALGGPPVVSHASYLINLASRDPLLRERSLAAMGDEIDRAEALGLQGVVLHPGCHTDCDPGLGLTLVAEALDQVLTPRAGGATYVILEHTAGQGTALGSSFEQLAAIIGRIRTGHRIGVCLDTCHLLASGYDIGSDAGYARTFAEFERIVGLDRLAVFHLNDSKKPLGSRVDRHTHIGEGYVGLKAFRRLVNDKRFAGLPMLLETPKAQASAGTRVMVDPLDARNLATLRSLVRQRSASFQEPPVRC